MKYMNPIIKGFYPDPSICRVGEDYFLVTSSFEYFPGIPLFHSKDLVNWKQIGNCIHRNSQLSLEKVKDSGGIWAPTIRHWNGTFYVTSTLEGDGNFIISTKDIYDSWSDPVWVTMGGIDPSLFFEDNKVYYMTNHSNHKGMEEISMAEIDIQTGGLKSEIKSLWSGIGGGFLEAPHIYHIGEWYYLVTAEGGTNFNHMLTIARSKSIWGEYESCPYNPILTNVHDTSKQVQCTGHGDFVEDQQGNWWLVHLGIRLARRTMSHLGRETFLTPVVWENHWPVVANNKMVKLENEGPLWLEQKEIQGWHADFSKKEWESQWIFLRNPNENAYERQNGKLKLYPTSVTFMDQGSPTFVGVRQFDFECHIDTAFTFLTKELGDEAGVVIYLASNFNYRIGKRKMESGDFLVIEKVAEDFRQTAYMTKISDGIIRVHISADKEYYSFSYSVGFEPMQFACKASTRFLSCEIAGKCFTGTVIGLYALSLGATSAIAEFDKFKMEK